MRGVLDRLREWWRGGDAEPRAHRISVTGRLDMAAAKEKRDVSPQWMRSDGDELWHEIAPEAHRTARCDTVVRGIVHQRRTVPMDGELCAACLAWRGVIEVLPRDVDASPWALGHIVATGWLPLVWPEVDPDASALPPVDVPSAA